MTLPDTYKYTDIVFEIRGKIGFVKVRGEVTDYVQVLMRIDIS